MGTDTTDLGALALQYNTANPNRSEHHVTVAQLREALADVPDEAIVVLAKDAEGNDFSPLTLGHLSRLRAGWYVPDSTYSGDMYDFGENEYGETYEPDGSELVAVTLDPTN